MFLNIQKKYIILYFILLLLISVSTYLFITNRNLINSLNEIQNKYVESEGNLQNTKNELKKIKDDILSLNNVLTSEQKKIISYQSKIDTYNDQIDELEKLTTIEPVLLQKYSKVYFLNEHYVPPELKEIKEMYLFDINKKAEVDSRIWSFLNELLEVANENEIPLRIVSAYRSFEVQANLKSQYTVNYGSGANKFSADQGYSEHQLGTTVDLTIPRLNGLEISFEDTDTYKWLLDNAYKYGFVISYPRGNSYYQFEPWHWRFVGTTLAKKLHEDKKYFYDLDQREIDEYLITLFD